MLLCTYDMRRPIGTRAPSLHLGTPAHVCTVYGRPVRNICALAGRYTSQSTGPCMLCHEREIASLRCKRGLLPRDNFFKEGISAKTVTKLEHNNNWAIQIRHSNKWAPCALRAPSQVRVKTQSGHRRVRCAKPLAISPRAHVFAPHPEHDWLPPVICGRWVARIAHHPVRTL